MIEHLFPEERNFGGEERREAGRKTAEIRKELLQKLEPEEKAQLDRLHTAYVRESNFELKDAYTQGFCDGMELMLEFYGRQNQS